MSTLLKRQLFLLPAICAASIGSSQTSGELPVSGIALSGQPEYVSTFTFQPQIRSDIGKQFQKPENPAAFWWSNMPVRRNDLSVVRTASRSISTPTAKFPGISFSGYLPADPDLAVGTTDLVQTVNSSFAIFDKATGTKTFQQSLTTLFSRSVDSILFDPKVIFDSQSRRFLLICLEASFDGSNKSFVHLAVSDDDTATGGWSIYHINSGQTVGTVSTWFDYPGLGSNADLVTISGNLFGFIDGFYGSSILSISKAQLLSGSAATVTTFRDAETASIQLGEVGTAGFPVYGIANRSVASNRIYAITSSKGGSPSVLYADLTIPTVTRADSEIPSGTGFVDGFPDGRLFQSSWRRNRLVAAHNAKFGTKHVVRWYEFNTGQFGIVASAKPKLVQTGEVVPPDGKHYHMGAVAENKDGSIGMVFTSSGPTTVADIMLASRAVTDPLGSMGKPVVFRSSLGTTYKDDRWGDFFDAVVDPVTGSQFWGTAMYSDANGRWETEVFRWEYTAPPVLTGFDIKPDLVSGGTKLTGTVILDRVAPMGGTTINLASDSAAANPPSSVTVPEGATSLDFTFDTLFVPTRVRPTLSAKFGSVKLTKQITLEKLVVQTIEITPSNVIGGKGAIGKITLNGPAPAGGATVQLNHDTNSAFSPTSSIVFAGQTSSTFPISSSTTAVTTKVIFTASYNGADRSASLTVRPPELKGLSLTPTSVVGGSTQTVTGRIVFSGPLPKPITVTLSSSMPTAAKVPLVIKLPQGASIASFTVIHKVVSAYTKVTITASAQVETLTTRTATLSIKRK